MATATKKHRPQQHRSEAANKHATRLREAFAAAPAPLEKIDKAAGILYGVKILGLTSRNTHGERGATSTRYTREALEASRPLYENADVFKNHKERLHSDDDAEEKLGVLRNVRLTEAGLIADFHYLTSVPFNQRIVEDAERGLGVFSFSHDVDGGGQVIDGVYTINRITEVRRVDIVSRGATNRTLYESDETHRGSAMKVTFRKLLESQFFGLSKGKRPWANRLLEQDFMDEKPIKEEDPMPPGGLEVDAPAPEASSPDEALKEGFRAALMAVLNETLDSGGDAMAALKKIKELLTTHSKLSGSAEPEAPVKESDDADKDDKDKPTKESLATPPGKSDAEKELEVVRLCESKKFTATPNQRLAMIGLTEAQRLGFINEIQAIKNAPRSQTPHGGTPPPPEKKPADSGKSFAESICR